jgi:hypothetical protein
MTLQEFATDLHESECKESHYDVCTWKIEECFRDKWHFPAHLRWLREAMNVLKNLEGL